MPSFLSAHFWLLCGLWVGGAGALHLHSRLTKSVASGALDGAAEKTFVKGWLVAITLPCVVLWLLQSSAGPVPGPEYFAWPAPQKWIALGINVICWVLLLWWVW